MVNEEGNRIVLSLGSNQNREQNMDRAVELLIHAFDSILFSERIETKPYGSLTNSSPFYNQVAIAYTPLAIDDLVFYLKSIEKKIGRTPEDKPRGLIPIDIDLIQWNETILKPEDLQREYIQTALQAI